MRLTTLLLLCLVMAAGGLTAQTRTLQGTVTDETGAPVAGASVSIKENKRGTTTVADGSFTLSAPAGSKTLVISYVGKESQEMVIGSTTSFNISLKAGGSKNLDEVVVTALGITRERRTLGYATQTVKGEALTDKGDGNLLNALQGKLAGADIVGSGGAAGASTSIILRGITSFTGNQSPIFVVDGIPVSDDVDESTIGLYTNQPANRTADLNVNDIESVNVLQGPAAAALYGSRASHGAIMITTKKGSGQKGLVNITYGSSYMMQKVYGFPELQNRYGQGANGVFSAITTNSFGPAFGSAPSLANGLIVAPGNTQYVNGVLYTAGQTIPYKAYPDNIMSYFKTGTVFENNLMINSGDARNNYNIAIGNSRQTGILPNSQFNKTNIAFSASTYFTDKLSVKAGATYFSTVQDGITQGSNGTYSSYANMVRVPRSVDFEYYKNHYTTPTGYNNWFIPNIYNAAIQDSSSGGDNPYFAAYKNPIKSLLTRVLANVSMGYDVRKWLNVSYRLGVDAYTERRKRTIALGSAQVVRSAFTGTPGVTTGGIMEDLFTRNEISGDLIITAKKTNVLVQGLNVNVLAGHSVNQRKFQQINQTGYGLAVPGFYNITNASNLSLTNEYNSLRRVWGVYGQLSLAYNNYLFLEFTGRQDHSSTLPVSKNAYFYPSVSAAFILSDALKINSNLLSFAKLRASYAKVGEDAPAYTLNNTYVSASDGNNVAAYAFPFGSTAGFGASARLGNKELRPEFTNTLDFGINLGLFKNRINIDATYYSSKSTDQIVSVAIPGSTGYQSKYTNVGELTNKGFEITVTATPVKTKNFSWNVSGNFSRNRNKVTYIAPGVKSFGFGGTSFSGLVPTVAVGEPFGIVRGAKWVTNAAGQRLIDSTTGQYANFLLDQTVIDPNRDWIAGLTNTFNFKRFSFSFLVDYKQGGQFESITVATLRANGSLKVTEDREQPHILPGVIDVGGGKYRPNNIQISGQSYYATALGSATGTSASNEFAVFDATTFRVRELSLSYDLSGASLNTKIFKNIKFTIYGRNLFFYAPNSLIDPELSTQGAATSTTGGLVRGLELVSAPSTRNIGASIRVGF
jgi:TonB-linked SusC/RagA family outer membrane protein